MGFLEIGEPPLNWEQVELIKEHVREHGVEQLIHLFNRFKAHINHDVKWGYELEYHLVSMDSALRLPKVFVRSVEIITAASVYQGLDWHPEYGAWMIEMTPEEPFNDNFEVIMGIEERLIKTRLCLNMASAELDPTARMLSAPCFPLLGVGDFFTPKASEEPQRTVCQSDFLDDRVIFPHPRFPGLTANIIARRRRKIDIRVPLFIDTATVDDEPVPGTICMDANGFGMGMCSLQVTFNTPCLTLSRFLHDQLTPLTPIMLALSACTPAFKGKLANIDVRWTVIAQAMDDRREEELESIPRPRYSGTCLYIDKNSARYNDLLLPRHPAVYTRLLEAGLDETLASHFAYIFIRDPLVVFPDKLHLDDAEYTNHFENFQSTNWQSMRFKPPPSQTSDIGWRIEFRPIDIQITDFENTALTVLVYLLSRVILTENLRLVMPISLVDVNMDRAHHVDAIRTQKFWFKKNVVPRDFESAEPVVAGCCDDADQLEEMTLEEIFFGTETFDGLFKFIDIYLKEKSSCTDTQYAEITRYFTVLKRRIRGEIPTGAQWQRSFIRSHPDYRHDSLVTPSIAYDLIERMTNTEWNSELLGPPLT
jgi:glutamate--cysteine ligase catalytic subunit